MILHRFLGMSDNWRTHARYWSSDYEVHAIDQRNHGKSFHSEAFDYPLLAQDIIKRAKDLIRDKIDYQDAGVYEFIVNGSRITDTNFDSMVFNFSSLNNLEFGSGANSNYFRGKVKALVVFNETLSDTELQNLTS